MKKCLTSNAKTIVAATLFSMPLSMASAFADEPQDDSQVLDQVEDQGVMGRRLQDQTQVGGGMLAAQFWASQDLETKVLSKINFANLNEIRFARLAARRALRNDVREFAKEIGKDHSEARAKLVALAVMLNRPLLRPIAETAAERTEMRNESMLMRRLERMAQRDFDVHFLSAMENAHAQMIEKLQALLPRLEGTKTAEHIKEIMPVMQKHLETAKRLQSGSDY